MATRIANRRGLITTVAMLGLVLTACSLGEVAADRISTESGSDGAIGAPATTAAAEFAPEDTTGAFADEAELPSSALGSGGSEPLVFEIADLGRDIIFTADLTVAVPDVAAAGDEATRIISGLGGFLYGQRTTAAPEPLTVLVFKVFPEDFQTALDRLGSIGDLRDQNVTADDVTERVVDLQSRINTADASVQRLRALLEQASDIKTIAEIENQLLERETQLETLRGQLRTLENQVSLATITLSLTEAATRPGVRVDVSAYPGHEDSGASCPGSVGLTVDKGGPVTMCFEIVNVGDTDLRGFTLRDRLLDLELDDLIVVFGDLDETIVPGESIVLAGEVTIDRSIRTQTTVTATPVDEDGNEIPGRSVSNTSTIFLEAVDPGGIPTFGEGLEASLELLVNVGAVLVLAAGSLIPFLPLLVVGWILWRRFGRRPHPTAPPVEERPEPEPAGIGSPQV
jgi:hypothetical protein